MGSTFLWMEEELRVCKAMPFTLKIILSAFLTIVAVGLMLRKTFTDSEAFESSIDDAVENRNQLNESWDQYYQHFLRSGFKKNEIDVVKNAIQRYSKVGSIMILPKDNIYADLKIDSLAGDDDKIMDLIADKLKIGMYNEGELLDNDINTVDDLFQFIKKKQIAEIKNNDKLFIN